MTFQEILEGITRHRAAVLQRIHQEVDGNAVAAIEWADVIRKIDEMEWALQALAETLRDREQQLEAIAPHERAGHGSDALNEVDDAFEDYARGAS